MHPLLWLGLLLLVAWGVLRLGLDIVSGAVHLLVVLALAFVAWGLVKRGARVVGRHV